jgi:hypothetical protein
LDKYYPKTRKSHHIKAKDFRLICLTPFPLETLDKLTDRFLTTGPLVQHPLAASQYVYRKEESTDTALHHLASRVEKQLEAKEYATVDLLNI